MPTRMTARQRFMAEKRRLKRKSEIERLKKYAAKVKRGDPWDSGAWYTERKKSKLLPVLVGPMGRTVAREYVAGDPRTSMLKAKAKREATKKTTKPSRFTELESKKRRRNKRRTHTPTGHKDIHYGRTGWKTCPTCGHKGSR